MSGVDERVETVREALCAEWPDWVEGGAEWPPGTKNGDALAALDSLAAAVADAEQRADERVGEEKLHAARAFRSALLYAGCGGDAVAVAERFVDAYSLAAAVVSAEPTEEQG